MNRQAPAGDYRHLFSITVEHGFFADAICRGLQWVPTAETERLLQRYRILSRPYANGVALYRQDEPLFARGDAPAPLLRFRYRAYAADPYFGLYTAQATPHGGAAPYFVNRDDMILHRAPTPDDFPATPDASARSRTPLTSRTHVAQPALLVELTVPEAEMFTTSAAADAQGKTYLVRLEAASVHWKYYFFGELAETGLEIHDLGPAADAVEFFPSCMPVPRGGAAFVSSRPIVMHELPTQRFQLRDKEGTGRILIKRLPNAGISNIGKEKIRDGREILVAEIYINQ